MTGGRFTGAPHAASIMPTQQSIRSDVRARIQSPHTNSRTTIRMPHIIMHKGGTTLAANQQNEKIMNQVRASDTPKQYARSPVSLARDRSADLHRRRNVAAHAGSSA